jgi:hypothetical protein
MNPLLFSKYLAASVSTGKLLVAAILIEPRQFPPKKSVIREVSLQRHQEIMAARQILLADLGDGQQNAREWGEQMALQRGQVAFFDKRREVGTQARGQRHRQKRVAIFRVPAKPRLCHGFSPGELLVETCALLRIGLVLLPRRRLSRPHRIAIPARPGG